MKLHVIKTFAYSLLLAGLSLPVITRAAGDVMEFKLGQTHAEVLAAKSAMGSFVRFIETPQAIPVPGGKPIKRTQYINAIKDQMDTIDIHFLLYPSEERVYTLYRVSRGNFPSIEALRSSVVEKYGKPTMEYATATQSRLLFANPGKKVCSIAATATDYSSLEEMYWLTSKVAYDYYENLRQKGKIPTDPSQCGREVFVEISTGAQGLLRIRAIDMKMYLEGLAANEAFRQKQSGGQGQNQKPPQAMPIL